MMTRTKWTYTTFPGCRVGTMICTACRKPIGDEKVLVSDFSHGTEDYRYKTTDEGYFPQHRLCSSDDPQWAKIDAERLKAEKHEAARRQAYDKFVKQYGVPYDLVKESGDDYE